MRFKNFVFLSVFVLGFFLVVHSLPESTASNEAKETVWKIPRGSEFDAKKDPTLFGMSKVEYFQKGMLDKYKEIMDLLYNLYEKGEDYDFFRMGLLLRDQAAVLYPPDIPDGISGVEHLANEFKKRRKNGEELYFGPPDEMCVSTINKMMNGYLIDRNVVAKFSLKFVKKKGETLLHNDTLNARMVLFHRNICRPDG